MFECVVQKKIIKLDKEISYFERHRSEKIQDFSFNSNMYIESFDSIQPTCPNQDHE